MAVRIYFSNGSVVRPVVISSIMRYLHTVTDLCGIEPHVAEVRFSELRSFGHRLLIVGPWGSTSILKGAALTLLRRALNQAACCRFALHAATINETSIHERARTRFERERVSLFRHAVCRSISARFALD